MDFGRRYGKRERVFSNPGSRFAPVLSPKYLPSGELVLEVVGQHNVWEDIQSYRDSCDTQCILRRYLNGETDVLQRVQGFYTDISEFPDTYAGMFQLIHDARATFDGLPVAVKQRFGNDFSRFLAASQSPDFAACFNVLQSSGASPDSRAGMAGHVGKENDLES